MKKLIVILLSVFFVSCDSVIILNDKEQPFVVNSIEQFRNNTSKYHSEYNPFSDNILILPTGMYNIGDTVKIERTVTFMVSFIEDSLGRQKIYKYSGFPKDMDEAIQKLIDKKR